MKMHDLVVRGGTIVDGRGGEPYEGDVAINGDLIAHVGPNAGRGVEEIDAKGCIVTPGFVDLHTHYDAQAMWDPSLAPSAWHGGTSLVMGNCGVGFAPVQAESRSWLIEVMENVEEIPRPVLEAGLNWDWQTFPQYLDALERRKHTIDIGAQLPHIALRAYVMGERAVDNEPATATEIATMTWLTEEALVAGALGLSCSHTVVHTLADGRLVPGRSRAGSIPGRCGWLGRGLDVYEGDVQTQQCGGAFHHDRHGLDATNLGN
jgi:N-acyl-D-amino-acid deacylase